MRRHRVVVILAAIFICCYWSADALKCYHCRGPIGSACETNPSLISNDIEGVASCNPRPPSPLSDRVIFDEPYCVSFSQQLNRAPDGQNEVIVVRQCSYPGGIPAPANVRCVKQPENKRINMYCNTTLCNTRSLAQIFQECGNGSVVLDWSPGTTVFYGPPQKADTRTAQVDPPAPSQEIQHAASAAVDVKGNLSFTLYTAAFIGLMLGSS
ncbi:uncharacterized protein LOC129601941 [Paramacrobiotus metropolitanus]|uniref:uncharacterized protein LOC129601941 n=1 Tax=Paramacrobiotus metropolitanus TaxID=2943436 RepID=UPI002445C139|nr:uncharacterized protein LOC129601941 [Paramacrobiotus metropolitanus]